MATGEASDPLDDWLPIVDSDVLAAKINAVTIAVTGETWRMHVQSGKATAERIKSGHLEVPWDEMSAPAVASLALQLSEIAPEMREVVIQKMEAALRRFPADFWLHLYVGQEQLKQDNFDAAVGAFRAAVAVRPDVKQANALLDRALAWQNSRPRPNAIVKAAKPMANTPALSASAYKNAADAELKFLRTRLDDYVNKDKGCSAWERSALTGAALLLAAYGEALGEDALRDGAAKIAEEVNARNLKAAEKTAAVLTVKGGKARNGLLPEVLKEDARRRAVMLVCHGFGGLDIESNLQEALRSTKFHRIETSAAELLGVRLAVVNAYMINVPNAEAKSTPAYQKQWEKTSTVASELSKQLVDEAGKGSGASQDKMWTLLDKLNDRCDSCHSAFHRR